MSSQTKQDQNDVGIKEFEIKLMTQNNGMWSWNYTVEILNKPHQYLMVHVSTLTIFSDR